jgi:IMP dehydrogenase
MFISPAILLGAGTVGHTMERKLRVEDYMIRDVVTLSPDVTVKEAIEKILATEFHGFPIVESDGKLLGFISAKELLREVGRPEARLRDVMRKGTITVGLDTDLDDAARILFRYWLRYIPVVDDAGKLIGIVSHMDFIRSHIEKVTPRKVQMVKKFLETKHRISIHVRRRVIPIDRLKPTQHAVFVDELRGRQYEIQKGLIEPIIVVAKGDWFILVDGHHRVLAARDMGITELTAYVLEPSRPIDLGMERTAQERGLNTLDDIKTIDDASHPLVEISTRIMEKGR